MSKKEFDLIQDFFKRSSIRQDVIQGIGDDAALLQPPRDQQLVATTDTLIVGKHFPENTSAFDIGYKSLAVNLSDLAAMGAEPTWILLALTLPEANEAWLRQFTQGFFSLMQRFNCQLVGGDLTCGPLSVTVQALGFVPMEKALLRQGAQSGDRIYVTGTLGDAGLALAYLQKKVPFPLTEEQIKFILRRLNCPEPRVDVGLALRGVANSAIDISDGLAADLGHILTASQIGAKIYLNKLPLSDALLNLREEEAWNFALSAGDDYELCFTVPQARENILRVMLAKLNCLYTCIGQLSEGNCLLLQDKNGSEFILKNTGYQHFRNKINE